MNILKETAILKKLEKISVKYKLQLLILFGSRANNTYIDDSDYDFAFLKKTSTTSKQRMNLWNEIEEIVNFAKVDLIDLEKSDCPLLRNIIFTEGICIYENKKGLFSELSVNAIFNYIDFKPLYSIQKEITHKTLKSLEKSGEQI